MILFTMVSLGCSKDGGHKEHGLVIRMSNDEQHHLWSLLGDKVQFLCPTLENPASQGKMQGFRLAILFTDNMAVPIMQRKKQRR